MYHMSHDRPAVGAYIIPMSLTPKTYPLLALLLSGGLLGGAYFFQYVLGYPPCQMCYWQRYVHFAVLGLAALALLAPSFNFYKPRVWAAFIVLALLGSAALAFYHWGVEYKWFPAPKTCAVGNVDVGFSAEDLLGSMSDKIKPPSCADAVWHFLGLSMAGWNMVASLFGAVLGVVSLRKKHVAT